MILLRERLNGAHHVINHCALNLGEHDLPGMNMSRLADYNSRALDPFSTGEVNPVVVLMAEVPR